jgi:hypothetical protein
VKSFKDFKQQIMKISLNDHLHKRKGRSKKLGLNRKKQNEVKVFANDLIYEFSSTIDRNIQEITLNELIRFKDVLKDIICYFHEFAEKKATDIAPIIDNLQGCIDEILTIIDSTVLEEDKFDLFFLDEFDVNRVAKEIQALRTKETYLDDFEIVRLFTVIKANIDYFVERFQDSYYYCDLGDEKAIFDHIYSQFTRLIKDLKSPQFNLPYDIDFFKLLKRVKNRPELAVKGEVTTPDYHIAAFRIKSLLTELEFKIEMISWVISGVQLHENSNEFPTNQTSLKTKERSKKDIENVVRKILSPLKLSSSEGIVIVNEKEFDILVDAYTNLIHYNNKLPDIATIAFNGKNKEFYPPFRALHDEFKIKFRDGGALLQRLIVGKTNNTLDKYRQRLTEETITKNIKTSGKS